MSAIDFYKLSNEDKKIIFTSVGEKEGLPAYAIEKDWWVVQTLRVIFNLNIGQHLSFKGGTSLSKAWGLINRFSEDIDLVLNREFLGFKSGLISKSQVRKLRTVSFQYITEVFYADLHSAFAEAGLNSVTFDFENLGASDQDPVSILIHYPALINHPEYIKPRVKVEIGSRSLKEPCSNRSVLSIVGMRFYDREFADAEIIIPCVKPERTYLEKLFLLHEEFQIPQEKIRVDRLSRHLYDVYKISRSAYKQLALDPVLITEIIAHRERFNDIKGVDYKTHFPPNLNPIPPEKYIDAWKRDYKKMQNEMIPGASLSFEELIIWIKADALAFNKLKV